MESDGGTTHAGVITFHRLDDHSSRVTAQMDIGPAGFTENVADRTGIIAHRVRAELTRFKTFIEQHGGETGAWRGEVQRPDQ